MNALLGRLAVNSAAALTVGGTVLALGIALGAVGLDAIDKASPWANLWVRLGSFVALLALAWIVTVFVVVMRATRKTDHFLEQVGRAVAEGKPMRALDPTPTEVASWAKRCRVLVEAGLGEGESHALAIKHQDNQAETDASSYLGYALARLVVIQDRPTHRVRFDFDHKRDWMGTESQNE